MELDCYWHKSYLGVSASASPSRGRSSKDAPILVMDEAVSNLDAVYKRLLRKAMGYALAGRTSLVIAHRLSIIRSADRIIVLEKGRTVEAGPHNSLLAAGGVCADLVAFQQRAIPL